MSGHLVRKYGIYGPYKNFFIEQYGEILHGKLLNRSDEGFSKYSEMSLLNFALTVHQLFKFNGVGANIKHQTSRRRAVIVTQYLTF